MSYQRNQFLLRLFPIALAVALTAPACVMDEEDVGTSQDELTNVKEIDVGYGRTRFLREDCSRRCVRYSSEDFSDGIRHWCLEWADACGPMSQAVGLFETYDDLVDNELFEEHPQENYEGCGPKAAQNVLRYYGLNISLEFIRSCMATYEFPFSDNIATLPADLADGLQWLLDNYGDGDFDVRVHSDKDPDYVKSYLASGSPAIMLVYDGNHYVTATGFRASGASYHIIDYTGESRWEGRSDLDMEFAHEIPFTSYQSGTVITIEHSNPVCECKPGERQSCGANDSGRQYCERSCSWGVCTYPDDAQIPPPPYVALEYLGCAAGNNTFMPVVAPTGVVSVTSYQKQYRIGATAWKTLQSNQIVAPSKVAVGLRAKACNANGCSAFATRSVAGPYCPLGGGPAPK